MNQPGLEPRPRQKPRAHRAGRRLAVRARDHEGAPLREEALAKSAGHRRAREAERLHGLRFGVGPPDRVAHDDEVRARLEVSRVVALQAVDAEALQHRTDRGIERHVGSAHVVARFSKQRREGAHAGAGDPDQVDPHTHPFANSNSSPERLTFTTLPGG